MDAFGGGVIGRLLVRVNLEWKANGETLMLVGGESKFGSIEDEDGLRSLLYHLACKVRYEEERRAQDSTFNLRLEFRISQSSASNVSDSDT